MQRIQNTCAQLLLKLPFKINMRKYSNFTVENVWVRLFCKSRGNQMRIGGGGSIVHLKFGIYLHVLDTYAYKCIYMDYIKFQRRTESFTKQSCVVILCHSIHYSGD